MSVQVLCPACGHVAEWHRAPVTECARCQAPYPEPLRLSVERALVRERAPRPLLLTLGQWASLGGGALFLFMLLLAPFDAGTYTIGDEVVSGPEFLRRAGWVFAAAGALLVTIGIGLWRERPWVRPLMVAYWGATGLLALAGPNVDAEALTSGLLFAAFGAAGAAWYLYGKPNVRAYFEARGAAPAARGGA